MICRVQAIRPPSRGLSLMPPCCSVLAALVCSCLNTKHKKNKKKEEEEEEKEEEEKGERGRGGKEDFF